MNRASAIELPLPADYAIETQLTGASVLGA
jgi:hypothetical protein